MPNYQFKTTPFAHQAENFAATRELTAHAWFWEMGTGKSKQVIDSAAYLYLNRAINGLLIVAPPSVHFNWMTDELPAHLPDSVRERTLVHVWQTSKAASLRHANAFQDCIRHDGLAVLCISYNGFMTAAGKQAVAHFLRDRKCFYVLDESAYVKTPGAKRTKSIVRSGVYAPFRRILTGTPVSNGPFDVYSQVKFLDQNFWRRHAISNAHIFRHVFGVWKTIEDAEGKSREFPVGYQMLDVLHDWLKPISSRVLKEDVLDLPPKVYTKRHFELSGPQRSAYQQLIEEFEADLGNGKLVTAPLVIQRLTKFRQITSGFVPVDDGEPVHEFPENPRLGLLEEYRDEVAQPAIVWAQYDREVDNILSVLGDRAVRHDGRCDDQQREDAKRAFKSGAAQFFVAKPSVGGTGLTLVNAKHVLYYSNSFNLSERLQSEDRAHRIGQTDSVDYTDFMARNSIDTAIVANLRKKFDIGAQVTGDVAREWL